MVNKLLASSSSSKLGKFLFIVQGNRLLARVHATSIVFRIGMLVCFLGILWLPILINAKREE